MAKIAVFGHKHIYSEEGGIEVVVTELAKRLCKEHDLTVFERAELDKPKRTYPLRGRPAIRLSPTLSDSRLNAILSCFFSSLRAAAGDYRTVHIHAEGQCAFLPMIKKGGKKVVVTVHGLDWQRAKWGGFASSFIKFSEEQMVKHADEIIVLSEGLQKYFLDEYGRETILIENGITPKPDHGHEELDRFGLTPGEYILYLGRIVPEKRLDLLVNAFRLNPMGKKLVIAGEFPSGSEEAGLWGKEPDIILTGFAGGKLKQQLLTNCGLFVLPSDLEGQSIALLEALSCGAPCLVSDIPENREILGEFGATFKAGDLKSLTEALGMFGKIRAGAEQVEYIKSLHNWDLVADKTGEVLCRKETKEEK